MAWESIAYTGTDRVGTLTGIRRALIGKMFGPDGIPIGSENVLIQPHYHDIEWPLEAAEVELWSTQVPFGNSSYAYHFRPFARNNQWMIVHAGHDADYWASSGSAAGEAASIKHYLSLGFDVVSIPQPLIAPNEDSFLATETGNNMVDHNTIVYEANVTQRIDAIRPFIEPTLYFIDTVAAFDPIVINMVGISGGGWTTMWCAALDTRVRRSYPVAGCVPWALRHTATDKGTNDWEQWAIPAAGGAPTNTNTAYMMASVPGFPSDYFVLLAMCATDGRRCMPCYHDEDPVCFAWGGRESEFRGDDYETGVKALVAAQDEINGRFDVQLVTGDTHNLVWSRAAIDADLGLV